MQITNKLIRNIIRVPAWVLLMIIAVSRMAIPVIKNKPIVLDVNDGYVIGGCLALLLCIEAVKNAVDAYWRAKTNTK
jgi:xanthine/uracil permease